MMFIRTVTTKRGDKTYHYPQLVESYRKPDGTPAHRVLCSLKNLPAKAIENLRTALQTSREGKTLVLAQEMGDVLKGLAVAANYRYLDLAVAYRAWKELRLDQLLTELTADQSADVLPAEVVASLTLHRCIAPGSKLAASQWYPTTALPELQGIAPARFGNSRVHRALSMLEKVEEELQNRLPEHLRSKEGLFASLFVDITDTWFEGRGPALAHKTLTKEGLMRKKIGLVLLCDTRGYPLRWETLPGNYYESEAMGRLVEQVAALDWVHKVPVVLDRAMGKGEDITRLAETGVRFVTALPVNEIESWTDEVPWQPFAELVLAGTTASSPQDLTRIQEAAKRGKLVPFRKDRWIVDLGVVTRSDLGTAPDPDEGANARALRTTLSMQADINSGLVKNTTAIAKQSGHSENHIRQRLQLAKLVPEVQHRVLAGEAERLSLEKLRALARQPKDQQEAAFEELLAHSTVRYGRRLSLSPSETRPQGTTVRLVVSFNPEAFLEQRQRAFDRLRELEAFVADLNRRLRSPQSRRRREAGILAEVEGVLRRMRWVGLFQVQLSGQATQDWQVELVLDQEAWNRRRRYDGFCVFAAHPDIAMTAFELITLYYAKDTLEKDFQTIKSELELRPVRHHTDVKVKAHVTLCVLALLIQRYLEQKLKTRQLPITASALFERLAPVHLNLLEIGSQSTYVVTRLDPDQRSLLNALALEELADDEVVGQWIRPRRQPTV